MLIIFVDIQNVLDIESDEKFGIDGDVLLIGLIPQIREINQESEEGLPDG